MKMRASLLLFALAALVGGCQTTSIRSAWFDSDFSGPPMRKIIVVGSTDSLANGRVFEDAFADRLRAAGVDGVAGYTVIPDAARSSDTAFASAVTGSAAQGLLMVRVLGVDTRTQVTTTMVPGGMGWGRSSTWNAAPARSLPVQQTSQYDLATVETQLFDMRTDRVVWAATTSTFNPRSVAAETPGFADVIIGQLRSYGIIAPR
jgi:hypothetical protein